MTQAVIKLAGRQFLVSKGDQLTIDKTIPVEDKTLVVTDVLLVVDQDKAQVGAPLVKGAIVTLKILENKKGPKVTTARFRAKSRSRKVRGARQPQTLLEVAKITLK